MFETYIAAMRLSKLPGAWPAYSCATVQWHDNFGKIMKLLNALDPDDGLTYLQRLFREHAKNKTRKPND